MEKLSLNEIIKHLQRNKGYLRERFGVVRMGIFGSFVRGEHTSSSDIDMVVEMEENKKIFIVFSSLRGI